ncbi:MAG: outer membrane beta-barrel protein [Bacteroidota bacterium]|nr:outer membrane beta-barrel protein [Bacteroidota bacterium]
MKKLLSISFYLYALLGFSQENKPFNLILTAGAIGSQVDGDMLGGYNKFGTVGGINLNKGIGEKSGIDFGLTYVQKGARKNPSNMDPTYYLVRLNYVEVPFMLSTNYKVKYRFEGGLSFAYLFKSHEESSQVGVIDNPFKPYDFCYNVGFGYRLSEKFYSNLRYSYSLVPIRDYNNNVYLGTFWTRIFNKGLYNNVLQVSINYIISPKEKSSE